MSRNTLDPEAAQENRTTPGCGRWTFNAPPPEDYIGPAIVIEAVRLGDHAHITVSTGHCHPGKSGWDRQHVHMGTAGRLIFAWHDWVRWRDQLEAIPSMWLTEVECPTPGMLDKYAG